MLNRKLKFLYYFIFERFRKLPSLISIQWRKYKIRKGGASLPPPGRIVLRITNRCNLRCRQCGQWGLAGVHKGAPKELFSSELSTRQWKDFIEQVGQKSFFCPHLHFFGGEPFLREDIYELIAHASRHAIITGVNTNGTFLSGKAQKVVASGLDYLIVSLDGPEHINNKIRLGAGNVYQSVLNALAELTEEKKKRKTHFPIIQICFTLTPENQHHIYETAEIANSLAIDSFLVQFGSFTTEPLGQASLKIIKKELGREVSIWKGFVSDRTSMDTAAIRQQVEDTRRLLGSRYNQLPALQFNAEDYFLHPEKVVGNKRCALAWLGTHVMPNGDVATCDDYPDIITGNILRNSLKDIWQNKTYANFRDLLKARGTLPFCSRCCSLYECDLY